MITLNDDLLVELGLGELSPDDKRSLLAHLYETLQTRVGSILAERMSLADLDEFDSFMERDDQEGAVAWMNKTIPGYQETVNEEFEALKAEVRSQVPKVLAAIQGT